MNLDDDSSLSAYLDDELDPADRLAIEWSVESSPPLGEQLRSLALARDAVAGLDRPSIPRDLAPIVVARLASNRRKLRTQRLGRPLRVALVASSFSAVAAGLLFALILLNYSLHPTEQPFVAIQAPPQPAPEDRPIPVAAADPTPTNSPTTIELANRRPPLLPRAGSDRVFEARPVLVRPVDEAKEQRDRKVIARMLENEHVRRIVIVTDIIDAPDRVQKLIQLDARKTPEYARVTICQDIVLDPDHAEAAEVFAVPMDERGRRSFVSRLGQQFPNLREERDLRPELMTQLGEVGQVAIFRGTEAAPLGDPPVNVLPFVANRTITPPDQIVRAPGSLEPTGSPSQVEKSAGPDQVDLATAASDDPDADPSFVGPRNPYRLAPPRMDETLTLIVWVTRPARR